MKYTIEFRDGLRYIEKEVEGRIPNIGETVWVDLNNGFYIKVCVVTEVVTDLTCPDPVYTVILKEKR